MRWIFGGLVLAVVMAGCGTDGPSQDTPAQLTFSEEPIVLSTDTGDIFGTLTLPLASPPFDHLALIISGSGPTDRNGNSASLPGRNDSLLQVARSLSARGIASVRFDKRGVGQSADAAPEESELRFETYVRDASAWLALLEEDARFRSVSIVGHSEGSLIGMLAAGSLRSGSFISIAGTSRRASKLLDEQLAAQLSPELQKTSERILVSLEEGEPVPDVPDELAVVFRSSVQPYLISWFKYDPSSEIRALDMPVLVVHGTTDIQIAVSDAQELHEAAPGSELVILEGMNHILKLVPADMDKQLASYSDPSLPVSDELIEAIVNFLE